VVVHYRPSQAAKGTVASVPGQLSGQGPRNPLPLQPFATVGSSGAIILTRNSWLRALPMRVAQTPCVLLWLALFAHMQKERMAAPAVRSVFMFFGPLCFLNSVLSRRLRASTSL
jgi:hypothetical protein